MAITSSLGIKTIGQSVNALGLSITRVKRSAFTTSKILMNKTKVKRTSLFEDRRLFQRKKESIRIKDQENIIEASKLVVPIKRGAAAIARSTQGFLGRLMEFTATLLTGWLLYNLPTLIAMAKELMARITRMVQILKGFVSNIGNIMTGFGNVLGAVFQNIISFDFLDTSKRVDKAMKGLTDTFDDMQSQFDEGIQLLTTSLGEGLASGENAPGFGTRYPTNPTPSGGFSGSGVSKGTQIARKLQGDLGLKEYQAAAIVGNLLQENTTLGPDVIQGGKRGLLTEAMSKGIGYGWAQWTDPGRQQELYQLAQSMGVDPSKQPLTDEINYAMLVREFPRYDSGGRFRASKNINEASNWVLTQYLRPSDQGTREQNERIADSNKILQAIKSAPTPAQIILSPARGVTTTVRDEVNVAAGGTRAVGLSGGRGEYLARGGTHKGIDIGTSGGKGYYVALKLSGTVDYIGWDEEGYGHFVDIKSGNTIYRFAHLAKVMVRRGPYNGETIGEIGNTGRSSSEHLHFEVRINGKDTNPKPYLNLLSIGRQLTGVAGQPTQVSTPTPAQIAAQPQQRRQQLPGQITPERQGAQIVLIDDVQPQQPAMPMGGGGGGAIIPIIINPLNSYITNKLMLDLAYT